jgi:ppGpp synthetase/RelA/SpoT-type nucleotidyltranferase
MKKDQTDALLEYCAKQKKAYSGFMNIVIDFFQIDNELLRLPDGGHVVHSIKHRQKDREHLRKKILRKSSEGRDITLENIFTSITDLCGVRVLHLRLADFEAIHCAITQHVNSGHWCYAEPPKAYTWDPEYKTYFEGRGVGTEVKESFYTSVHYVVKPNQDTFVTCEIQVRSLFEEIWGEVDHQLNYPVPTASLACREQLKVLAKLVGAGTRLVESIYKTSESDARQKGGTTDRKL